MTVLTSPHSLALDQLSPFGSDAELDSVGIELDRCKGHLEANEAEMLADTCTEVSLSRWETVYELSGDGTVEQRKQALLLAINADSGISTSRFQAIAIAMGFTVVITAPKRLLRAGTGRVGGIVYDEAEQYTWGVTVSATEPSSADLVAKFDLEKPPFTAIHWTFEG